MWASWGITAVALAGAAFMLRFLIALLREGAPSVSYCVVPVARVTEKQILKPMNLDDVEDEWQVSPRKLGATVVQSRLTWYRVSSD
jgi:hypothetical protein